MNVWSLWTGAWNSSEMWGIFLYHLSTAHHQPTYYNVVQQGYRHAEYANEQIADCQVQDEEIGDRVHMFVPHYNKANHRISHHTQEEDQKVRNDEDCCHLRLVKIVVHVGNINI